MKQLLLVNIHLFTIRHPAEVARVKIEKLKRIPILHNSNLTNQRVLQVYQYFIFAIEQFNAFWDKINLDQTEFLIKYCVDNVSHFINKDV